MKKLAFSMFCFLGLVSALKADDCIDTGNYTWGHTYLSARPVFRMARPEVLTGFRDRADARCDGAGGAFQFVPFGGRSTNSKGLARYFSPCPKTELLVDSDNANVARDINPAHFGIQYCDGTDVGAFQSTIQFRPQQTYAGLGISWKQYLGWNDCCERSWYFWLNTPIVYVKNDMRLKETTPVVTGVAVDGTPANMVEAFKGNANGFLFPETTLTHGKIDGSQKKTQLGDIELFLGYEWINDDCHHLDAYAGIVIPTSNTPKGEYVFEAIAGNGNHFGFMWGTNYGADIWQDDCAERSLALEFAFNYRYLFSKTSTRSFDLKDRKWSRYMLIFPDEDAFNQAVDDGNLRGNVEPAINNLLTRKVKVTPRSQIDFNTGLVYDSCNFRGEVGYNVWARQSDKVCLKETFVPGFAVADINAEVECDPADPEFGQEFNFINRLSNIGNNNDGGQVAYNEDNIIQRNDLNLSSAASPCALTHMFYGYLGYHWDEMCYPTFAGVGASYEFSAMNTALDRWMVWGKIGFSI